LYAHLNNCSCQRGAVAQQKTQGVFNPNWRVGGNAQNQYSHLILTICKRVFENWLMLPEFGFKAAGERPMPETVAGCFILAPGKHPTNPVLLS
jgi:hypothetical protein